MCLRNRMRGNIMGCLILFFVHFVFVNAESFRTQTSPRVVSTQYGQLQGVLVTLPDRHLPQVESYLGIQYASVLNGELRFMPPTSPQLSWDGQLVALKFGPVCPQKIPTEEELSQTLPKGRVEHLMRIATFLTHQAEECLNLNVYVPIRPDNETSILLPVIVYIHGESYSYGTGNAYDGSVLASFGKVIVLTLNYRLGVLGFLTTGDSRAPGNYGLLDIIAALHWVKENIRAFGGDPQSVTLLGQGYGSAIVNLLLISPVTKGKGLFKNAILQSGSALSSWAVSKDPLRYSRELANRVNCSSHWGNSETLLNCLKSRSIQELSAHNIEAPKYFSSFGPVIDHRSVLPRDIRKLLTKSRAAFDDTNILLGVMKNEGFLYFTEKQIEEGVTDHDRDKVIRTYVRNLYQFHRQKVYEILMHHYTDWEQTADPDITRDTLMELLGDGQYVAPMLELTKYHAEYEANTYLYSFSYPSRLDSYPKWAGGVHGDDITYVFGAPLIGGIEPFKTSYTKSEKMLTEAVMRYWTNFAKTGNPNEPSTIGSTFGGRSRNRFAEMKWPTFDNTRQEYLHIGQCYSTGQVNCDPDTGTRPTVRHHYRGAKMALWLDLIPKLHQSDGLEPSDHLLHQYDNSSTFEESGTEELDMDIIFPPPPLPPVAPPKSTTQLLTTSTTTTQPTTTTTTRPSTQRTSTQFYQWHLETREPPRPTQHTQTEPTTAQVAASLFGSDSTLSLSVTIAVGCSLLILNILIFAGVYYQKDRMRVEMKMRQRELEKEKANMRSDGHTRKPLLQSPHGPPDGMDLRGSYHHHNMRSPDSNSTTRLPPSAPPAVTNRHPHSMQGSHYATLPKGPIPVNPPLAPYSSRASSARDLPMSTYDSPHHLHSLPRNASPARTLDSNTKLRHSPSADSGTDVNSQQNNPVTVV